MLFQVTEADGTKKEVVKLTATFSAAEVLDTLGLDPRDTDVYRVTWQDLGAKVIQVADDAGDIYFILHPL